MKKQTLNNIISGVIILLLLTTFLSYAYFSANIHDSETDTTITASGGTMDIYYVGGPAIVETNIEPSETPFAEKEFTIKGNSTIGKSMNYYLSLIVKNNTFSNYSLSYNLSLISKTGDGTTVSETQEDMCYLFNGAQTENLGSGSFSGPTDGDETHTYNLKMYFPDTGKAQNIDQGKTINAYIRIKEGTKSASECKEGPIGGSIILANNGGRENITFADPSIFDLISTSSENIMYKMEDDYGMSYYFRGAKDYVNNNLIFAEHQWKIIRINGDGSLRIIYNGTCPGNACEINTTGPGTNMFLAPGHSFYNSTGESAYNFSSTTDNKYVGYMYGGANGEASTSREQATLNETDTRIKSYLDSWYIANISGTDYEDYIADTLFCNDRQLQSEVGGAATGTGFGNSKTYYAPYYRLSRNKTPSLKCNDENDRFTTTNYNNLSVLGNNALDYPIGLLIADEGALAGLKSGSNNSTNYLYTNQDFWTMSPFDFYGSNANVWDVRSDGSLGYNGGIVNDAMGVRGVLNLASNTPIIGTGTILDPYVAGE